MKIDTYAILFGVAACIFALAAFILLERNPRGLFVVAGLSLVLWAAIYGSMKLRERK